MDDRDWRGLIRLRYALNRARRVRDHRVPTMHSARQNLVSAAKYVPEGQIQGQKDGMIVRKVGGGEG